MKIKIPGCVLKILWELRQNGYEAYIVGGCVRDSLLFREPSDWDITTNALPEIIQQIFPKSIYANQFGTVGVLTGSDNPYWKIVEVTTYRQEGKYTDKRHPDNIRFAKTLAEDLSRRDFTINALALEINWDKGNSFLTNKIDDGNGDQLVVVGGKLIDLFNGLEDLKKHIIRAVGNPDERFAEDSHRLIKAVRFATELSFTIEKNTWNSLKSKAKNILYISEERIRDELIKIIMTPKAADGILLLKDASLLEYIIPELLWGVTVNQNKHHIYPVFEHLWRSLDYAAKQNYSLEVRLAALFHDIGKPKTKVGEGSDATFYNHEIVSAQVTRRILTRLKFPNYILEKTILLVRYHQFYYDPAISTDASLRRLLAKVGKENIYELAQLREADRIGSGCPKAAPFKLRHFLFRIEKILKELEGLNPSLKMLKINGNDIMNFLYIPSGPKVGYILNILLEEVLDDIQKNNRDYLLKRAAELNQLNDKELKQLSESAKEKYQNILQEEECKIKSKYYV